MPAGRIAVVLLALALLASLPALAQPAGDQRVWLALSDIHLDPFDRSSKPSPFGRDANLALLRSAIAEMKRAVPDPAVVLLPGDFLAHNFARLAHRHAPKGTPDAAGAAAMRVIAAALDAAFPRAQFAVTLGNNDAPCGDYRSANGSAYLAAIARIWAPLVNRHGAAPRFVATFERYGYYTAALPVRGLRLIVLNSLPFSTEYQGNCGPRTQQAAADELAWLQATLHAPPPGARNVVLMHIPPGFDPFSTEFVRGFLAWPYLRPSDNVAFLNALTAPGSRVAEAIAGHAHRFDFRLAGRVPVLVLGSLSPIYDNDPTFYALHVAADGSLRDVDTYAFDVAAHVWSARSFDRTWAVTQFDAVQLLALHARLGADAALRDRWNQQANGWPANRVVLRGTWSRRWWRVAWCAQTLLASNFAQCAGIERRVHGLQVLVIALLALIVCLAILLIVLFLRNHPPLSS